ncbi:MAG: hypothetical protein O3B68_16105 [Planctomycetota bacterium]|nr:hypothetical protein [Planctomycetota bacterium]
MTLKKLLDNGWVRFGVGFTAVYSFDIFWDFVFPSTSDFGDRIGEALGAGILIWGIGGWPGNNSKNNDQSDNEVLDTLPETSSGTA